MFNREANTLYGLSQKSDESATPYLLVCKFSLDRLQTLSDLSVHPILSEVRCVCAITIIKIVVDVVIVVAVVVDTHKSSCALIAHSRTMCS